jgi:3-oxoacyl-[acyl-carrier-protein] synthase III
MLDPVPVLTGVSYVLGEHERSYLDIEGFSQIAARYQMIEDPSLWGWGSFRKTAKSTIELALEAGRQAIDKSGLAPADIDVVILCATQLPTGIDAHAASTKQLLEGLGLGDVLFLGVTLNRCATMLSALCLANDLVKSGQRRAVLVISSDKSQNECERFQHFALFSDGASGCVVAAGGVAGYAIVGTASAIDANTMSPDGEISAKLARRVNDKLLAPAKLSPGDIKALLHNNLYAPIVKIKEQQAGFRIQQLFLDNIRTKGHCFGSDPLINLADYAAKGLIGRGDYLMLVSSVPGLRFGLLVRQGSECIR